MPLVADQADTSALDPVEAVAQLREQLGDAPLDGVLFFCSPDYDLEALGPALKAAFDCPVVGCTAAGQIGRGGFQRCGILAAGLRGGGLRPFPFLIAPLTDLQTQATVVGTAVRELTLGQQCRCFALLLVDGLSHCEEYLAAMLYQTLDDVPLVGGSAGDDLRFERTHVYHDGRFLSDAAVLTVFECDTPFAVMKFQHFVQGEHEMVVTDADPYSRLIRELDGEPAALAYAQAVGRDVSELDPEVFSTHPLVLGLSGEPYVRSIQRKNPDLSLACYCAVEEGMLVSVGHAVDPMGTLEEAFARARGQVPEPALVIGCDCVLRRLEFEQNGEAATIGRFMAEHRVFGFSTYGEQFNGLHVNQTFTGVVIGK